MLVHLNTMLDDIGLGLNLLKIFLLHHATLFDATCWPRLNTMLEDVRLSLNNNAICNNVGLM